MGISSYENLTRNINQLGGVDTTAGETGDVLTLSSDGIWRPANPAEGQVLNTELTGFSATVGTVTDSDTVLSGFEKLQGSVTNLEDTYVRSTRFSAISSTTGTITKPANSTIILNDFGGEIDCDIQSITSGRPNGEAAFDTNGVIIAAAFDTNGSYVLSGAPAAASVALVYRVRQKFKDYVDTSADILGGPTNESGFVRYLTVAAMKAASGFEPLVAYCEEKSALYKFCDNCPYTADDDLVTITGSGGNTRWEMIQKMSRTQGDTGWINSDDAIISATSATAVRMAISSIAAIAIKGVRIPVPIGNYDATITGGPGVKFVGFDDSTLVLKVKDALWDFNTEVPVMVVYWSGTAIVAAPQTEFHGIRDTIWHAWAHLTFGMQYVSGLAFTGSVQTDSVNDPGANDTVTYLWSTTGTVRDEDITATPGAGKWLQTLGSGLTSTTAAILNFFYFNGTAIVTAAAMADRSPFLYSGANGTPRWNSGGTLTDSVTGDYIVYHYFATPMTGGWSVFARPHNAKYTTLAAARAARPSQLTWSNYAELKHIYTAIFRVNTGWSTTHRCKLVALDDYRLTAGSPVAATAPTAHSGLSSLELAGAGVTYGHIDDQAQTIAGAKTWSAKQTFNGFSVLGDASPSIKLKKLTGTTGSSEGAEVAVAHGLTASKIIAVMAKVESGGLYYTPGGTRSNGYQFDVYYGSTDAYLGLHPTNSENVLSKGFVMFIVYEE